MPKLPTPFLDDTCDDDDDTEDADDDVGFTLGYEYDPDLGAER